MRLLCLFGLLHCTDFVFYVSHDLFNFRGPGEGLGRDELGLEEVGTCGPGVGLAKHQGLFRKLQ